MTEDVVSVVSEPRATVVFQSAAFNTTEARPHFINPDCFGDDLAKWLIPRFRAAGATTDDEPGQEDFGWYFDFAVDGVDHCLVLSFRPGNDVLPGVWIATVERARGLLASIFKGRRRGVQRAAVELVHRVLASAPEIAAVEWHASQDFLRGEENNGSSAP
jgi:hypothetical protein